ncbi:hypothetical protein AB0N81_20230 [Streptomyces sp. NPDC093510]|uniref:hypothetical protein n=1 Tax=Streptomyces sp. NPDC093510 TaxID=3155199 RepID=UPI0034248087
MSLAEDPHPGVGVVDVDVDLAEVVDEVLQVLRLELLEVERYARLAEGGGPGAGRPRAAVAGGCGR